MILNGFGMRFFFTLFSCIAALEVVAIGENPFSEKLAIHVTSHSMTIEGIRMVLDELKAPRMARVIYGVEKAKDWKGVITANVVIAQEGYGLKAIFEFGKFPDGIDEVAGLKRLEDYIQKRLFGVSEELAFAGMVASASSVFENIPDKAVMKDGRNWIIVDSEYHYYGAELRTKGRDQPVLSFRRRDNLELNPEFESQLRAAIDLVKEEFRIGGENVDTQLDKSAYYARIKQVVLERTSYEWKSPYDLNPELLYEETRVLLLEAPFEIRSGS